MEYILLTYQYYDVRNQRLCIIYPYNGNPPLTDEIPTQNASYAESISMSWRHHDMDCLLFAYSYIQMFWMGG